MAAPVELVAPTSMVAKGCDVCGEREALRELGARRYECPTRTGVFEFAHEDVCCERCGFVFSARTPDAEFLRAYYASSFTHASETASVDPDYDADARLALLGRHLTAGAEVLEIGASNGEFCELLRQRGYRARGIDPLEAGEPGDVELGFLAGRAPSAPEPADAVVAYYVLEHVTDAVAWLTEAAAPLVGGGGVMVLEVPDLLRCPVESLYPEHFLHWTPSHLESLVRQLGFDVVEVDRDRPSRAFGFGVVARRLRPGGDVPERICEAVTPDQCAQAYAEGRAAIDAERARREALADELAQLAAGRRIVLWAANDLALSLARALAARGVDELELTDNARDKAGRRLPGFDRPIVRPSLEAWRTRDVVFVLCSPAWNRQIAGQIADAGLTHLELVDAAAWSPA